MIENSFLLTGDEKRLSSQRWFFETKALNASAVPLKLRRVQYLPPLMGSNNPFALTQRTRVALTALLPSNGRLRSHRT
ncbi:MAG: hypothetical protein EGQ09_00590 [Clostridiales bacterium]|nr:hypothetical protein [Clostridiales bacterium]